MEVAWSVDRRRTLDEVKGAVVREVWVGKVECEQGCCISRFLRVNSR